MKIFITSLLAIVGLTTACGKQPKDTYEVDVFKTKNGKEVHNDIILGIASVDETSVTCKL